MDGGAQLISILTKTAEAADPDAAPVYYAAVVWQNGTVVEAGSFSPTNPGYKILASTQALYSTVCCESWVYLTGWLRLQPGVSAWDQTEGQTNATLNVILADGAHSGEYV